MESFGRQTLISRQSWLTTTLLVFLVAVLGSLQYRWLGQVADANRLQSKAALETAVQRFADEFNGELSRLFVALKAGRLTRDSENLGPEVVRALEDWRETADFPELVKGAYLLDAEGFRAVDLHGDANGSSVGAGVDPATASAGDVRAEPTFETSPPLDGPLKELRDRLAPLLTRPSHRDAFDRDTDPQLPFSMLSEDIPALVLPYVSGPGPRDADRVRRRPRDPGDDRPNSERSRNRRRHRREPGPHPTAFIIIHLDQSIIAEQILPSLADRHFGDALRFHLRVFDAFPSAESASSPAIFEWGPEPRGRTSTVDAEAELFGPLMVARQESDRGRLGRILGAMAASGHLDHGRWRLSAQHPEGSLDIALERARRQNLLLASGILAVLAAALLLLTRNASRSRRLAQQQLDFVAGITHEIMTPLAALRSAGQNLADGLITDPQQIGRYGRMIDREGQRLTNLVGQVLAFARMQSQSPRFNPEALAPASVVQEVIRELRPQLEAENVELEENLDPDLPAVLSDRQALTRALGNLVSNAIKYGQTEQRPGWVGMRCRRRGTEVVFEVEDRGPGIANAERSAIFEPFYRGTERAAGAVPGTGLGLALVKHLVESQGGKVGLLSKPGQGSTFRIVLPIAASEEPES